MFWRSFFYSNNFDFDHTYTYTFPDRYSTYRESQVFLDAGNSPNQTVKPFWKRHSISKRGSVLCDC